MEKEEVDLNRTKLGWLLIDSPSYHFDAVPEHIIDELKYVRCANEILHDMVCPYGETINELQRVDYRPHHAPSHL